MDPTTTYPDGIASVVRASSTLAYADRDPVVPDTAMAPPDATFPIDGLLLVVVLLATLVADSVRTAVSR
jgi:hypothetical protein